jgi:hypothetical protein
MTMRVVGRASLCHGDARMTRLRLAGRREDATCRNCIRILAARERRSHARAK